MLTKKGATQRPPPTVASGLRSLPRPCSGQLVGSGQLSQVRICSDFKCSGAGRAGNLRVFFLWAVPIYVYIYIYTVCSRVRLGQLFQVRTRLYIDAYMRLNCAEPHYQAGPCQTGVCR